MARLGQFMAFLAALILASNPSTLHAQMDGKAGHSHSAAFCDDVGLDGPSTDDDNGTANAFGCCVQHCGKLAAPELHQSVTRVFMAVSQVHVESNRHLILTSDPPPPRPLS